LQDKRHNSVYEPRFGGVNPAVRSSLTWQQCIEKNCEKAVTCITAFTLWGRELLGKRLSCRKFTGRTSLIRRGSNSSWLPVPCDISI